MRKKPVQSPRRPSIGAASRIYSRENVGRYAERARQRRRGRAIRRGLLVAFLGVLVAGTTAAGMWLSNVTAKLNNSQIITSGLRATLIDSNVAEEPFYMLLLGTDARPGETNYRADTIILARVDPVEKELTLISIPRDTKVEYKGETMKINAAHYYDGAEGMVDAVNELMWPGEKGKISHYAEINFNGLEKIVDALGGITVDVPDRVDDPKAGDYVIEPGEQVLNGAQALTFARSRAYVDGDYTRMRHQRIVISAIANKVLNGMDVSAIPTLINSVADMVVTDLKPEQIIALANAMRGMDTDNIWSANVPSWAGEDTYINGVSYVFVMEDELRAMMKRVDAGEDPQGPQSMGSNTSGSSATVKDLTDNDAASWREGTAVTSSSQSSSSSSSSSSSDSSE